MNLVTYFITLVMALNLIPKPLNDTIPVEDLIREYSESQSIEITDDMLDILDEAGIEYELTREEMYSLDLDIPEPFTEDDLRMLTTMVFKENGLVTNDILVFDAENPNGVYMPADVMHEWTAQVCLNHLKDDRFPNTIYEDLEYPRYTSEYRSKQLADKCRNENPEQWKRIEQTCLLAMNGYIDLPSDVVYESNFPELGRRYAAVYVDTGWFNSWCYFAHG